jgi:hypothetical protein
VKIPHPMGKMLFYTSRQKAPESPPAVHRMYEFLIGSHPDLKGVIRKQLRAEYGVDPLSAEARRTAHDGDLISGDDVRKAMTCSGLDQLSLEPFFQELQELRPSKALILQERMLEQNPVLDYIVCGEEGQEDHGIEFLNKQDKIGFRTARHHAPKRRWFVGTIYKKLAQMYPDLEGRIRGQMIDEYGIDPASVDTQNATRPELDDEEMRGMNTAILARWPTMQQLREKSLIFAPGNEKYLSSWM